MLVESKRSLVLENRGFSTQEVHREAVECVIQTMRANLYETLSLEDMADVACLSPYYFCRVFHQIVGVPPGEFLTTLRLDLAKRLLLTTSLSVTDICFEVGYAAPGSFTTRFTQMVCLSPRQLRNVSRNVAAPVFSRAEAPPRLLSETIPPSSVSGHIYTIQPFNGFIFAGLFPKPIPQGKPTRCTLLLAPGPYSIRNIPDGRYFLLIAALPISEHLHAYLLPQDGILVGIVGPITVQNGIAQDQIDIVLRAPCMTDPPLISVFPFIGG